MRSKDGDVAEDPWGREGGVERGLEMHRGGVKNYCALHVDEEAIYWNGLPSMSVATTWASAVSVRAG